MLDERPHLINAPPPRRWSVLHHAAQTGECQLVKELIERGADCSMPNRDGLLPLWVADPDNRPLLREHTPVE